MIFLEIDLKPVGSVLQHRESCLAESPQGNDTSRKSTGDPLFFQYLLGFLGMEFDQLARTILHFESRAVGCHARFAHGVKLLDPLRLLLVRLVLRARFYRSSFFAQQDTEKAARRTRQAPADASPGRPGSATAACSSRETPCP